MGTRADFYVGRGETAEWLGSIAYDGYPDGIDLEVLKATTENEYRTVVADFFGGRDDATFPIDGWPWPWEDSNTTDYAYAFGDGQVWANGFGHGWFAVIDAGNLVDGRPESMPDQKPTVFPLYGGTKQAVTLGERSGLIVLRSGV